MAWRHAHTRPGRGGRRESYEPYACRESCFPCGEDLIDQRRDWRCSLPDMPTSSWSSWPGPMAWGPYLGGAPDYESEHECARLEEPPESHEHGCPGGWYRCQYVLSFLRYERPCSEGSFSSSPILDRTDDPLVLASAQYYERQLLAARSYRLEGLHGDDP